MSDAREDKSDAVGTASLWLAGLNAAVLIGAVAGSLVLRHKFAGIFADFDIELPAATTVFLAIPWGMWLGVTVVLLALLAAKELGRPKWIPLCLNVVFLVAAVAGWILFYVAMWLPLVRIIDELS